MRLSFDGTNKKISIDQSIIYNDYPVKQTLIQDYGLVSCFTFSETYIFTT